jgi:hypothetical protein
LQNALVDRAGYSNRAEAIRHRNQGRNWPAVAKRRLEAPVSTVVDVCWCREIVCPEAPAPGGKS